MQRQLTFRRRSDEEQIKTTGFLLDFDELARKGTFSPEDAFVAKWYGLYKQRQPGNFMARIVLPGGVFTSAQARAMAKVAEDYAQGRIAFTTRQCAQLHWLKLKMLPEMLRDLSQSGLSTTHGCGDVTRNVTACSRASTCRYRRLDVLPHTREAAAALTADKELKDLPRKFKITFSGCGGNCAQPYMNCVGLIGLRHRHPDGREEDGFRVTIGGGHGWQPFVAQHLFGFIPASLSTALCKATAQLYRDHGDRWNRSTSRLKYVVYRLGIDRCRELIYENLAADGVDVSGIVNEPLCDDGPRWQERPLAGEPEPGTDGLAVQPVRIPGGEINFRTLIRLAELSEMYGDKYLRATNRQNLEIHGVRPEWVPRLREGIEALGYGAHDTEGLHDVASCVGTTYCPMAVTYTHDLLPQLVALTGEEQYAALQSYAVVNATACPNACVPYAVADIGFRGARLRQELGSLEGYELRLGGTQEQHGHVLGTYAVDDCVPVARALLDTFAAVRNPTESLAEAVERLGVQPFGDAVSALKLANEPAPAPHEYSATAGQSMTPLDRRTLDKDIPCRAACPASTRVPYYLEAIAQGKLDEAYLINQEDNVFPGVLGRICTRPCEDACRHQWTGTQGPVAICHLKRAAADRKANPPRPLAPWFEATGKRVAIIGSGPAGLTCARELGRYGHTITLLEAERELGGMMRLCIPHFRLPRDVLEEEIDAIIDAGVEVRTGEWVDHDRLEELLGDYDAVVIAAGAILPSIPQLEGLEPEQVVGGVTVMKAYNKREPLELKAPVLVVGGGFTAIDCARMARRVMGPDGGEVALLYRRTEAQMSAHEEELRQLALEGIDSETLVSPVAARSEDGALAAITLQRNRLLPPPEPGAKPALEAMPDSEYERACGTLVFATGQTRVLKLLPPGATLHPDLSTDREGLYVAGDFSTGSLDVISAVASGKRAAERVDLDLSGTQRRGTRLRRELVASGETGRLRDHDLVEQPAMAMLPPERRAVEREVELGLDAEDAEFSAWRCYLCHTKYEIDSDACIHCDWCIKVSPRECIRRVTRLFTDGDGAVSNYVETEVPREATFIWIDSQNCIRCGNCLRICPVGAISAHRVEPECFNR